MYKVFIYDKPVLIKLKGINTLKTFQQIYEVDVNNILNLLKNHDYEGVIIESDNPEADWLIFKKQFKFIIAAGGVVKNKKNEILLIHRIGKWDLPKGKLEEGEDIPICAIREVEEECNVTNLAINKTLPSTFHCYPLKDGRWALKETFWFEMETDYLGELIPQTEEGIDKVIWGDKEHINIAANDTYASIKEILKIYL
jgi:8-oxo-dGTP pyrophosphatase MutT (NUDIX family)